MCASLVAKHYPDAHILVCTQSNSAADLYVKYLDAELRGMSTLCSTISVNKQFSCKKFMQDETAKNNM